MIRARVRQALPASLLVYGVGALLALVAVLPLATSVPGRSAPEAPTVELTLVVLRLFGRAQKHWASYGAAPLALQLVLTPWLRLLWLRATDRPDALTVHATAAARGYWRALVVWAVCGVYALALLLMAAGAGWLMNGWLAFTHDARVMQLSALLAATPFLLALLLHAPLVCDLANAAVARDALSAHSALRIAWHRSFGKLLLTRAAFGLVSAGVFVAALLTPRALFGFTTLGTLVALVGTQLSALLRTLLRSVWLAALLDQHRAR
jgi:hypothetical protein